MKSIFASKIMYIEMFRKGLTECWPQKTTRPARRSLNWYHRFGFSAPFIRCCEVPTADLRQHVASDYNTNPAACLYPIRRSKERRGNLCQSFSTKKLQNCAVHKRRMKNGRRNAAPANFPQRQRRQPVSKNTCQSATILSINSSTDSERNYHAVWKTWINRQNQRFKCIRNWGW